MTINQKKIDIELINAYGPYDHSHWQTARLNVSHENRIAGRGHFIVKTIKKILNKHFNSADLRKMTIVDVGCYDGWILHQLSRLPFKKLVGIEPREKNIIKGKQIRGLLGIKTRVNFKQGDLELLAREKFDIVACIGVLHHIESVPTALRWLDRICKKMIIIETLCLSSKHITEAFKNDIEMKDVVYEAKPKICGVTGQKYESSYYNGSTVKTTVVSVPSVESLVMYLDILGYEKITIAATPTDFKKVMKRNDRPSQEVLIYAFKGPKTTEEVVKTYIEEYEKGLIETLLDPHYLVPLYEYYCARRKRINYPRLFNLIRNYINNRNGQVTPVFKYVPHQYQRKIIKNLKFNPEDKIRFEYGKLLYSRGQHSKAIAVLQAITKKLNADWRCVYRSFYLLAKIYYEIDDSKKSRFYAKLYNQCHPVFPLSL